MKRPLAWLATGLPAAAVLAVAPVALGSPAADAAQTVSIRTFAGKCLDVKGASRHNDAPIVQYRCNGQNNQRFHLRRLAHGRVQIRTFAGKCLDVRQRSNADNATIVQYHCNGRWNQHFRLGPLHVIGPITTFAHKCLTMKGNIPIDDIPLVQLRCSGLPTQQFTVL
ncbi:RICIN domain-containing protein [Actinomadura gamaensis]|uniref:RICIN domain-containing protein n=1 Tax=Actinomadura gamaensis TaxID=1763541 RepID=A0ABV9U0X8_9ACTN